MLKLINAACIEASTEKVWKALAELEKITLWAEPIVESYCENQIKGVGAVRVCKLKGNMTIRERWIDWQEEKSFSYIATGMPLIKSAKNTWSVIEENNMTLLKSEAEIVFKGGIFGRLLEPLMGFAMKRMGPQSLAGLKYWVENGQPFAGNYSRLPIVPISC